MSEYSSLKATINASVKTNGNQEITGSIMNSVLNAMVNSLGAGYQFMGVATPTNPGSTQTPDYKCFYIATTPGKYTNLGGLVVADGEVALLKYGTSWTKEVTGIASADKLNQLGQKVDYLSTQGDILFNKAFDTSGGIVDASGKAISPYIDVSANRKVYVFSGVSAIFIGYGADKSFVDYYSVGASGIERTLPNTVYFIRITFLMSASDSVYVSENSSMGEIIWRPEITWAKRVSDLENDNLSIHSDILSLQEGINKLDKRVDLSPNFKVFNYYDNSAETETSDALSTVKIPIPSWATYFLQTGKPKANYGDLGFNFYDNNDVLIASVRYSTSGITRYLSDDRCGIGFAIPANSAFVRLYSNRSNVLFSDMTAEFYSSQDDVEPSTDLLFHKYGVAHLKELDPLDEQLGITKEVIDTNLTKENYYNYKEEQTPSTQPDGISTVKIPIPSWATYVIVGNTTNYSYIKYYCYNQSGNLIAEKRYNGEGVSRHDYWDVANGYYYYLGSEIPNGTAYIRIGYISTGMFLLATACVKFYKSSSDVPVNYGYNTNPYRTYQERNLPQLKEYTKTNNWYYWKELPDYYFPYLSNKAAEIESYLKTCASNCDVFFFITDTHFDFSRTWNNQLNACQSFAMMAYLRKYLRIDTILHGGELFNLPPCGNFMEDYKQVIGTNQVYLALGNHEFISLQDQNVVNYFTRMLSNGMIYGDENKMWGYVDNPTRKSRYIVLSPFGPSPDGTSPYVMDKLNDDNQYNWFVNTALDIPAGYTAVIISHLLYTLSGYAGSSLILPTPSERYVNAIDNYSGVGKIACVLMGHTHSDRMHIGPTGIPYIISQTDRFYTPGGDHEDIGVTRTRGTITEQHFEVVVINKVAKEIKLFAIGSNSLNGMDDNIGTEVTVRTLSNLTNI